MVVLAMSVAYKLMSVAHKSRPTATTVVLTARGRPARILVAIVIVLRQAESTIAGMPQVHEAPAQEPKSHYENSTVKTGKNKLND